MATKLGEPQRRRAREMFPVIKRYQDCGLTQKEFCEQENLALHVFHYWLKKYKQEQPSEPDASPNPAFLPIELTGRAYTKSTACEIALPTGIVIRFSHSPKPEQLAKFITSIGA